MLNIMLQGREVCLLPERALLWPGEKTLIVSDLHWGKSAHFRKHGIAVPANIQTADETRLARLIDTHKAERLIIAGDLFHSKHNNEVEAFALWRQAHHNLHIDFVAGNHDTFPAEKYLAWNLTLHPQGMHLGPFFISHDAPETCDVFCIHGHVHPAIRIARRGHGSIKLCCFCEDENRLILPAFGSFTGNHILSPKEHKHIYVIAETEVVRWR